MSQDFILTYRGLKFTPLDPKPEQIDIEDIATALANANRFGGHSLIPYSVATHSVHVMNVVKMKGYDVYWQLIALFHDASEAYISDIVTPVKKNLPEYRQIENKIQSVIYQALGIEEPDEESYQKIVKQADLIMIKNEMLQLMRFPWLYNQPKVEDFIEVDVLKEVSWAEAKATFLYHANKLLNEYKSRR